MKSKVYNLLLDNEATRSNDTTLYIEYIKSYSEVYKNLTDEQKEAVIAVILSAPQQSSLTRERRLIQNTIWDCLPSDTCVNKRRFKEKKVKGKLRKFIWYLTNLFD